MLGMEGGREGGREEEAKDVDEEGEREGRRGKRAGWEKGVGQEDSEGEEGKERKAEYIHVHVCCTNALWYQQQTGTHLKPLMALRTLFSSKT